ncbi:4'-phosphopantetheinyl transferase family protein [Marinobacter sp. JSM 1782161]|uniref:4'-phosphopantetheinyl transferase family protein n=1 Tax=Marinobacter sp. JSM 1782161 TaxID=2685906 RepID=UPI001402BA93|nr:4'-phosphopantetheinyl transferase superfamily protein [Marinobacter sp. JSM 1782161]
MTSLPACCRPGDDRWPWSQRLPGLAFTTLSFNPDALSDDDFERCGIEPPENVRTAAAKRRTEYLAGRLCARHVLQQVTGIASVPATGADRAPQWPDACVGSITHSHGYAAVIAGHRDAYQGLGLDAEVPMSDRRAQRLAREILTPDEQRRFGRELADTPGHCLTLAFSLKESLFKALNPITGQRFYFHDAELVSLSGDGSSQLRLLKTLSNDWRAGAELEGLYSEHDGVILSLTAVAPNGAASR